ncbi:DJ-1/PfpI family protein [Paenibacillus flagellatus]|uniref:DJ-1/PfpI family protein n=1 Tax=Paenibacillus flagellatus TaxID=2211139 RepID=A0A2V5KC55_9BACL|nr:DJ-1/PfpI family protein [Paenibacillus flagellatus]PYI55513.1 DJ-1/PfpI family protein [Paenibacillus flagellatus]
MLHVQIVLFDGFDLMDVIGPYEVFVAAKMLSGAEIDVSLVSAEGARTVQSGMNGPGLAAVGKIDPARGGILIVPGAMGTVDLDDSDPDAVTTRLKQATETELKAALRQAMEREQLTVATVCGGALLLAMDGLLENRYAVTHHLGMEVLGATGAKPVPARVVTDGNLVTGGGVTSGLDVALYLIERELGPQIAHAVEKLFEYERRGTVWHATGIPPLASRQARNDLEEAPDDTLVPPMAEHDSSARFDGTWDLTLFTPVGKLTSVLTIHTTDGIVQGTMQQGDEVAALIDPRIQDDRMTWSQTVRKPMRLHLKFVLTVQGDRLTGVSKAGLLPSSKVEGVRRKE